MSQRFSTHTYVRAVYAPSGRAAIEISRGSAARAIELLEPAARYELGFRFLFLSGYLRGQAYLRARQGLQAAAEFQKILDHRGAAPVSPRYALAHLGLARAHALAGDAPKSRKAYQDFLALWKDADPDIPILQEAKREYAALK